MMEGQNIELSPGLQKFLVDFKDELEKSREMSWEELRKVRKLRLADRPPGEDVFLVKDILCYFEDKSVNVRIYQPEGDYLPILVYFHGGGWVLGDLDTHDPLCRKIAN
ncbi:MAG: alpha/beta hydrolase, partial [Candidatus Kariarchaeaceae archaeon]